MKDVNLPDGFGPGKAGAQTGRKKKNRLTDEQVKEQRERLINLPEEEKKAAMDNVARFIVGTILKWGFDFKSGPFSYEEMQGNPVEVISWDCYSSIYLGERRWPKKYDLRSVMVNIARSKIDHILKKYIVRKRHQTESTDDETKSRKLEEEIDKVEGYRIEMGMRKLGIDIALNAVSGNEMFEQYINAMVESNDYKKISKKMDISKKKVYEIERDLLLYLSKH